MSYEKLKSVIQEANPEIMEWRCLGCNRDFGEYINGCPFCWNDALDPIENEILYPVRSVKVVAREIRLADVLLAITKEYAKDENDHWIFFGDEKQIILQTFANWNLKDDNLDKQSEETKQFLINLLVHEKENDEQEKA